MTIKVDLGIVFNGLIILLAGIAILIIGIIWAVFSLFLASSFNAPIAFSIVGVVLIAIGVTDILNGVRGWKAIRAES